MKKWYQSKLMWTGIVAAITASGDVFMSGGDWKTAFIAALSALVALFRLGTNKEICSSNCHGNVVSSMILAIGLPSFLVIASCGSSIDKLNIDDAKKQEIAIKSGCTAAASLGCFEDNLVQQLFGKIKTSEQCVIAVSEFVEQKRITPDIVKMTSQIFTCRKFKDVLRDFK